MKKYLLVIAVICTTFMHSQEKPVKIVFDVSSSDEATQQTAIRHVKFMSNSYPDSQFEVVVYSGSLNMVLAEKSSVAEDILTLTENKNVSFKVCAETMKRHEATEKDLIKGVQIVPDGLMEIVSKQQEGWGYIKEAKN